MKWVQIFFSVLFLSFFIYSTEASSSGCVSTFTSKKEADAAKKQSIELFIQSLEANFLLVLVQREREQFRTFLNEITPLKKEHFETAERYIKQLRSWGFHSGRVVSTVIEIEPFKSFRDKEFKEMQERVDWLVSLGLSSSEAATLVINDTVYRRASSLRFFGSVLVVSRLTPKRQLRFEQLKGHITWLMDLGIFWPGGFRSSGRFVTTTTFADYI